MGFSGSILVGCFGLLSLRFAQHHCYSVEHRLLYIVIACLASFTLFIPLLSFGLPGGIILMALSLVLLFPYKQFLIFLLERTARTGIKKLASDLRGKFLFNRKTGYFTLNRNTSHEKIWIGNVLNKITSLDKEIRIQSCYYMLAFVIRLPKKQNFNCSIIKGWPSPRFHDAEYRSHSRQLQGSFSISTEKDISQERKTGGNCLDLEDLLTANKSTRIERYSGFSRVLNNNQDLFETIFSGSVYDALINCNSYSQCYEVNITPSSINIYTTLCNYEIQKMHLELLLALSDAVKSLESSELISVTPYTQDAAA